MTQTHSLSSKTPNSSSSPMSYTILQSTSSSIHQPPPPHHHHQHEDEDSQTDAFLAFIEHAKSVLSPEPDDTIHEDRSESTGPGWSWIVSRILKTCIAYSSGVTAAILLSDLFQVFKKFAKRSGSSTLRNIAAWNEQRRISTSKKRPEFMNLKRNHQRSKLPNTVTIDSIYEKNFLSLSSVLEAVIMDAFVLPGTNIYMLTLGDFWSSNTIDLYLHRRYYDLVNGENGILKRGRGIFLTGCRLRTAEGSGCARLLPTEYVVTLLDEDQDDDAILLGAQFCSDSFASITLDASNGGASYSLYARIESIGPVELLGETGSLKRKQIALVDGDGVKMKFLLWGEQILLANLFSVGSMIALDRPYIASCVESALKTSEELCLEYGSATQLYLVPCIQQEEQVSIALSQSRYHGSRLQATMDPSQGSMVSQVTLPCDSEGSIDFSNYPFQPFIVDLRDKMTGVSLYGVVTDIYKEGNDADLFYLRIEDTTGAIRARLHFSNSWSLKRLSYGHTVFISRLTCSKTANKRLEVLWHEKNAGSSVVNLSCLPAMLNSKCLHKLSCLSYLSSENSSTYISRVWIDQIEHHHIAIKYSHSRCGHYVKEVAPGCFQCCFCREDTSEVISTFHMKITIADETAKIYAWCAGQTAAELLQISPEEFYNLPEDEQLMYPSSLEGEKFKVAIVNCRRQGYGSKGNLLVENNTIWEITSAMKSE